MALRDLIQEGKGHRETFTLWPARWRQYQATHLPNPAWMTVRLSETERSTIPQASGVYTLLVQPCVADHPATSYLMYVGQAIDLRSRFEQYLTSEQRESGRPKVYMMLTTYPDNVWFCYAIVAQSKLNAVENELLSAFIPPCNSKFPATVSKIVRAF